METTSIQRKQTIFRFEDSFISKLKYYAAIEEKSLNSYVEEILKAEIDRRESLPKLTLSKTFSPKVEMICGVLAGKIKEQDLKKDDRLSYLLKR